MKKKLFSGFYIFIIATLSLLSCHSKSRKLYYPNPGSVVFSIQTLQNNLLKTVASQEFVYMSNNSNRNESIEFCPVESTGSFGICKHTGPHVESAVIAIHPSQQYAYIGVYAEKSDFLNFKNPSKLYYCTIENDGSLSNCTQTGHNFVFPITGIALNDAGTYAYLSTGANLDVIWYCPVNDDGSLGNCQKNESIFQSPYGIAIKSIGGVMYAYITNANISIKSTAGSVSKCILTDSGRFANNSCEIILKDFNGKDSHSEPVSITINQSGTNAYIVDSHNNSVTNCSIDQNNGNLSACINQNAGVNAPNALSINTTNNALVLTGAQTSSRDFTSCFIDSEGSLGACVQIPNIKGISPAIGPIAGGTPITITGNFPSAISSVTYGTATGLNVVSQCNLTSNTEIVCSASTPALNAQVVDIRVTNTSGGTSAITPDDKFTYGLNLPVSSSDSNAQALDVGLASFGRDTVTLKICEPGSTTHCVTVSNIIVDTGSIGLRIPISRLTGITLPIQQNSTGDEIAECAFSWGPIVEADVYIGNLYAPSVKIQQTDAEYQGGVPSGSGCAHSIANGLAFIGLWPNPYDCTLDGNITGSCAYGGSQYYYCNSSSGPPCMPYNTTTSIPAQVENPIIKLPQGYNNGYIIQTPNIPLSGASTLPAGENAYLIFGINTQTNNTAPAEITSISLDINARGTIKFGDGSPTQVIFDTGTSFNSIPLNNESVYLPYSLVNCYLSPYNYVCINSTSPNPPISQTILMLNAQLMNTGSNPSKLFAFPLYDANVYYNATPFETLINSVSYNVESGIPGLNWPFFFGRTVYFAISGQVIPGLGTGPFIAF